MRSATGTCLACLGACLLLGNAPGRAKLTLDFLEEQTVETVPVPQSAGKMVAPADPAAIEEKSGGRLGIALVDAKGHLLLGFNRDDRFALCSTFKAPLAAAVLAGADKGNFGLEGMLPLRAEDVLDNAPLVKSKLKRGRLSIGELAQGAVEVSDNSAANLLLPLVGGPEGLTAFLRNHGDMVTRLDRTEPALNENAVDDPRDTTSPAAMATLMARLLFQDLPTPSAAKLRGWLESSKTGARRIRAGLPTGWSAGDKSGSCVTAYNDVAVLRSPRGNDYVLAIYLDRPTVPAAEAEAAIAQAARATLEMMNSIARSQAAPAGPPASVSGPPMR